MKRLLSFFEDSDHAMSSMRLVLIFWCLCVTVGWIICSITAGALAEIPNGVAALTAAFLSAKQVQSWREMSPATTTPPSP